MPSAVTVRTEGARPPGFRQCIAGHLHGLHSIYRLGLFGPMARWRKQFHDAVGIDLRVGRGVGICRGRRTPRTPWAAPPATNPPERGLWLWPRSAFVDKASSACADDGGDRPQRFRLVANAPLRPARARVPRTGASTPTIRAREAAWSASADTAGSASADNFADFGSPARDRASSASADSLWTSSARDIAVMRRSHCRFGRRAIRNTSGAHIQQLARRPHRASCSASMRLARCSEAADHHPVEHVLVEGGDVVGGDEGRGAMGDELVIDGGEALDRVGLLVGPRRPGHRPGGS